jgi:hypothetical protein
MSMVVKTAVRPGAAILTFLLDSSLLKKNTAVTGWARRKVPTTSLGNPVDVQRLHPKEADAPGKLRCLPYPLKTNPNMTRNTK